MKMFLYRWSRRLKHVNHWLVAVLAMGFINVLRLLPPDTAMNFVDALARRLGPLSDRHRIARENLANAFPWMTDAERETIALDMWANMARLVVEYAFLDQLFDYDETDPNKGRFEIIGTHIFDRLRDEKKAHIIFTGHLGNFEMLPVGATAFKMDCSVMFRPPNNPYLARYVFATRRGAMGQLLESSAGVAFALSRVLEQNGSIGVLVDQKFRFGVSTTFFGRECKSSPLLPKLARHYECDVYPARCIRLPGNRFRIIINEKIELPRNAKGVIDVQKSAQMLNDIVEGWIREDPGQWMWFHQRWGVMRRRKKIRRTPRVRTRVKRLWQAAQQPQRP